MWHMHWMILASLLGCTHALKSTTGREFVTGFLSFSYPNFNCVLKLDIASSTNGDVEINVPYLGINTTYSFNRTFSTTFKSSLQLYGTQIGHSGVYIKSTVDVSVYVTTDNSYGSSEDTHVCLPVQSLGRAYHISSYTPYPVYGYPSLFMVISAFANTVVNITFPNGTSISKTLNWLDVYQEATLLNDLTGTIVQSSKPVSVVSGVSCTKLPQGIDCDMVGEQMIPTNAFQTHFIVPPILSNQFMVRIFSSKSNNTVCVKDVSFENCTTMDSNKWLESEPNHLPLVVTSQQPVSVIQYNIQNNAFMTTIPGIRQFMNWYTFVVPEISGRAHNNYISVIVLSSASQSLRLDGKLPSDQLIDTAHVIPPFNNYTVLTFGITTGYHVMTSTETHVEFGLTVFGIGNSGAYGYPAGINFDIDECASNPCWYGSTCLKGVTGYTCSCRAGVSGRNCDTDINECASSPCFHGGTCSDGVNAYTCTCSAGFTGRNCEININECASSPCLYGGRCSDGVNAYTCTCSAGFSGRSCEINIDECASSPCLHGGTCSDGVNAYTCTCSAGFSGRSCEINSNKQLICYSCEDMSHLDLCDTVQTCGDGDVCVVERTRAKYRSGCANSSICYYPSSSHCAECCNNDFCNGRGCGDEGIVSRHERGPLCFDCSHVRTIDECTTITPCDKHQSCSIEEFKWMDHTQFKLGCVDSPCSAIGNGLLRSLPRCKSCCDQDFCNTNCTQHQPISLIG